METEPLQMFDKVLGYYNILESIHLDETVRHKLYLGNEPKKCRFCEEPNVTFDKDAHAFPEFIGNKHLLSHHECDTCNKEFGENIETDMANLCLYITSLQVFKVKEEKFQIINVVEYA